MWAYRVGAALRAAKAAPRNKAALAALRFELRNWRTTLRAAPAGNYEGARKPALRKMERALRDLRKGRLGSVDALLN